MTTIFALLLAYQLKHFLADYPLQGTYMLGKFQDGWGFVLPLLAHVSVHATGTFLLATAFGVGIAQTLWLAMFDASVHFVMDRIKAGRRYMGRWKPLTAATYPTSTPKERRSNTLFWWALGFDQMVHHLTHYVCIWWIVGGRAL